MRHTPVVCRVSLCAKAPSRDSHKSSHLFQKIPKEFSVLQQVTEWRDGEGKNADHQWSLIHIGVNVIDFPLCRICLSESQNKRWLNSWKGKEKLGFISQLCLHPFYPCQMHRQSIAHMAFISLSWLHYSCLFGETLLYVNNSCLWGCNGAWTNAMNHSIYSLSKFAVPIRNTAKHIQYNIKHNKNTIKPFFNKHLIIHEYTTESWV